MSELKYTATQMNNVLSNSQEYYTNWREAEKINKELRARIAELEAKIRHNALWQASEDAEERAHLEKLVLDLKKRIAELEADGIHIEWMNEDELPEEISDEVYSTMYACSAIDFVRFFPFVTINGHKRFLIELPERER